MERGTVKFFNESKGFGFITPENTQGKDIFVHISNVQEEVPLQQNDKVTFETISGRKGPEAGNVRFA